MERHYLKTDGEIKGIMVEKWIRVEDKLPEPFNEVLARGVDGIIFSAWRQPEQGGIPIEWMLWCKIRIGRVTHWMPLPDPPKEKGII